MAGPVDFTLERARLINTQPLGNFDGGYVSDATHASTLGRNGTGGTNIQDMARVGTPSSMTSLGQYQGRFIPPSLPLTTPGAGYSMMSSFLSGGGTMGEHLKSLVPDLQQYWSAAAHGDGCARYIVNNNTIYSPYLPYLPATESLSLFAHNVGVSSGTPAQAQINAYHRIYDLHKEALFSGASHVTSPAGMFGPVSSGISPPSSRVSSEPVVQPGNLSVKKESNNRHGENKRSSDSSKHTVKSTDSHSKSSQQSLKHSKDHDRRTERRQDKTDKTNDSKQQNSKNSAKSDSGKESNVNNSSSTNNSITGKKQKQITSPSFQEETNKVENKALKNNKNSAETTNSKPTDAKQENKSKLTDNKDSNKEETAIPTLTTVTLTSGDSVTSPQLIHSPSAAAGLPSPPITGNGVSPDAVNGKQGPAMAQTSTTFSLPYYHAIYSHSQPSSSPEGKKVHAPTFTPEIGTLPSVVSVVTLPVQTTACDMRIKKEKTSYTCCKEKCLTVVTSNTNTIVTSQQSCTAQSPTTGTSENVQKKLKKLSTDSKEGKPKKNNSKSQDSSKADSEASIASVKPVVSNTNKITVHPVKFSTSNKVSKVSATAAISNKTNEDISNVQGTTEKEEAVKNLELGKCKSTDKQDTTKQDLSSHIDRAQVKNATTGESKVPTSCADESLENSSEKISITSMNSNPSVDKKDGRLLKVESVVTVTSSASGLHKKTNDLKHSSRKMKVMSPQRDLHLSKSSDFKHVSQTKLHEKNIRPREAKKGDTHNKDEGLTTGMNIPIGIAVAQKREELKEENADQGSDTSTDGTRSTTEADALNSTPLLRDGPPSAFAGPIISKSSSPNASVPDMRNTLPANLIVTGSANGAGIAWSDDPSARHFTNPWLPTGHGINPSSWLGQVPFSIPPNIPTSGVTDPSQLPISVPPGYKLVQDSVTGQLMIIPASNLDVYDPNRLWTGGFPNAGHPGTFQQLMAVHQQQTQLQQHVLAQHQERQPTSEFAMLQQYQQQYQHLYQPRSEMTSSDAGVPSTLQQSSVIEQSKALESNAPPKEIQSLNKATGQSAESNQPLNDKDKTTNIVSHQSIQELNIHNNQPLPYQYPAALPIVYNAAGIVQGIPVSLPENITVKTEASTVQSRGTSPMVPASEIDDTSQETIDAAPSTTESSCDTTISLTDAKTVTQSIASVQTCVTDISCCTVSVTSLTCSTVSDSSVQKCALTSSYNESKDDNEIHASNLKDILTSDTKVNDGKSSDHCDIQIVMKETKGKETNGEITDTSLIVKLDDKISIIERPESTEGDGKPEVTQDSNRNNNQISVLSNEIQREQSSSNVENYNPFLDPQILQAADGLELLSTLAEKRAKCMQVEESDSSIAGPVSDKPLVKTGTKFSSNQETPKPKKKAFSRTRSVPAKCETKPEQAGSYYTSTGLRIPQDLTGFLEIGDEEINAIELDMRIRLAELQRLYKEKQRQLAKLHPKKEKDDPSKRGPGRPRKRTYLGLSKKEDTPVKAGPSKGKDTTAKKKKQAEALVDRVFRKTGGGFGMPLSKKLKANAMAALFKTQSGFTVKRKGSTACSSLAKPCEAMEMHQKGKKSFQKQSTTSNKVSSTEKGNQKTSQQSSTKESSSVKKQSFASKGSKHDASSATGTLSTKKALQKKRRPENNSQSTDNTENALGILAKYATSALGEHPSLAKKAKKKKEEGVCTTSSVPAVAPNISQKEAAPPCKDQANTATALPCTNVVKPANNIKRESESDASPDSSTSSNKKRKPGRPRKCNPNATPGVTETIVSRNSKNFRFYQFQSFEDVAKSLSPPPERKPKPIDSQSSMKPLHLDEEWLLRRSERIFLSEPSPQPSPNNANVKENLQKSTGAQSNKKSPTTSNSVSTAKSKSEKAKLQKAKNIQELTQKVKRKYSKQALQSKSKSSKECKQKPQKRKEKVKENTFKPSGYDSDSSSGSEGDNIPLSVLRERPSTPEPRSCVIDKDELKDGLRVLVFKDGLFYEGAVQGIRPPDVYGVLIDNERGNRPHIYSREEILKEVIIDVKPGSYRFLPEGTRICAYWSQQFSCLYPGTVAKASPNVHVDKGFVSVEFDDGDSGRIPLDHIRMLNDDFPVVSYDPNPLLLIGKRRRHTTTDSAEQPRKSQSSAPSSDTAPKPKRGPGRPPKLKKEERPRENDSEDDEEEEEVDVCGFDEDNDEVFASRFSMENFRKERAKSHASSGGDKHTAKKRKEKSWDVNDSEQENKSSEKKRRERRDSSDDSDYRTSDQAFLPARQLWKWSGKCTKRPGLKGKAKKEFYKAIVRGKENIMVGDCAVFLSTGRPHLPYIGRIDSMWEAWGGQMVVKVKWFYHPEETRGGKKLQDMKGALFQSLHIDENDVQTISHKCEVLSYTEYCKKRREKKKGGGGQNEDADVYYLAGTYEPTIGLLKFEKDMDVV